MNTQSRQAKFSHRVGPGPKTGQETRNPIPYVRSIDSAVTCSSDQPVNYAISSNRHVIPTQLVLSSDSGLSSIVNQSEPKDSDSEISELNGLKRLLIQDIERCTKIIYSFENEKFVIRVNSPKPTLKDFKNKFHDQKTQRLDISNRLTFELMLTSFSSKPIKLHHPIQSECDFEASNSN